MEKDTYLLYLPPSSPCHRGHRHRRRSIRTVADAHAWFTRPPVQVLYNHDGEQDGEWLPPTASPLPTDCSLAISRRAAIIRTRWPQASGLAPLSTPRPGTPEGSARGKIRENDLALAE